MDELNTESEFTEVKKKKTYKALSIFKALIEYTSSSKIINEYLRNNIMDNIHINRIIESIDNKFLSSEKGKITVYRGLRKNLPLKYLGLNKAYISTDININQALYFAGESGCLLKINVNKNVPHIKITNSPFIHENEILLPRNLTLTLKTKSEFITNSGNVIAFYTAECDF
jgi:hypothetical protein